MIVSSGDIVHNHDIALTHNKKAKKKYIYVKFVVDDQQKNVHMYIDITKKTKDGGKMKREHTGDVHDDDPPPEQCVYYYAYGGCDQVAQR